MERYVMIVAGLGFSTAATADSLRAAYELAARGCTIDALATVANKEGHKALTEFVRLTGLPLCYIRAAELAEQRTLTCSPQSQATYGTGSVAEASALAAAGSDARLVSPRHISNDRLATCAIAIGGQT
ncbi:cobalamin biosynthesis protein [Ruegeria arenilitoris]|uniref:cobalamin biosynthesis protein n=1 Tax=Ruegeria arenilitoris TaxID=1173585 RepID=UPI003F5D4FA5